MYGRIRDRSKRKFVKQALSDKPIYEKGQETINHNPIHL